MYSTYEYFNINWFILKQDIKNFRQVPIETNDYVMQQNNDAEKMIDPKIKKILFIGK